MARATGCSGMDRGMTLHLAGDYAYRATICSEQASMEVERLYTEASGLRPPPF